MSKNKNKNGDKKNRLSQGESGDDIITRSQSERLNFKPDPELNKSHSLIDFFRKQPSVKNEDPLKDGVIGESQNRFAEFFKNRKQETENDGHKYRKENSQNEEQVVDELTEAEKEKEQKFLWNQDLDLKLRETQVEAIEKVIPTYLNNNKENTRYNGENTRPKEITKEIKDARKEAIKKIQDEQTLKQEKEEKESNQQNIIIDDKVKVDDKLIPPPMFSKVFGDYLKNNTLPQSPFESEQLPQDLKEQQQVQNIPTKLLQGGLPKLAEGEWDLEESQLEAKAVVAVDNEEIKNKEQNLLPPVPQEILSKTEKNNQIASDVGEVNEKQRQAPPPAPQHRPKPKVPSRNLAEQAEIVGEDKNIVNNNINQETAKAKKPKHSPDQGQGYFKKVARKIDSNQWEMFFRGEIKGRDFTKYQKQHSEYETKKNEGVTVALDSEGYQGKGLEYKNSKDEVIKTAHGLTTDLFTLAGKKDGDEKEKIKLFNEKLEGLKGILGDNFEPNRANELLHSMLYKTYAHYESNPEKKSNLLDFASEGGNLGMIEKILAATPGIISYDVKNIANDKSGDVKNRDIVEEIETFLASGQTVNKDKLNEIWKRVQNADTNISVPEEGLNLGGYGLEVDKDKKNQTKKEIKPIEKKPKIDSENKGGLKDDEESKTKAETLTEELTPQPPVDLDKTPAVTPSSNKEEVVYPEQDEQEDSEQKGKKKSPFWRNVRAAALNILTLGAYIGGAALLFIVPPPLNFIGLAFMFASAAIYAIDELTGKDLLGFHGSDEDKGGEVKQGKSQGKLQGKSQSESQETIEKDRDKTSDIEESQQGDSKNMDDGVGNVDNEKPRQITKGGLNEEGVERNRENFPEFFRGGKLIKNGSQLNEEQTNDEDDKEQGSDKRDKDNKQTGPWVQRFGGSRKNVSALLLKDQQKSEDVVVDKGDGRGG